MKIRAINKADFDTSVRAQDDFYRYTNGGWFKKTPIPKTESRWGSFDVLNHENRKLIHSLLTNLSKKKNLKSQGDDTKMRDLYLSSMDIKKRDRQGSKYLKEGFGTISEMTSKGDMALVLGKLHKWGIGAPWNLCFDHDDKNSKRRVIRISQGGLGVPDRGYHLKKDKESKRIRAAYEKYITSLFQVEGFYTKAETLKAKKIILKIETRLAKASMTPVERRDAHAQYNKRTISNLVKLYPEIPWKNYLDYLKIPAVARKHIIVDNPKFLKTVNVLLKQVSLPDWKVYLHWHFLSAYSGTLGTDFINTTFEYSGKVITGKKKLPELWKRSVSVVAFLMEDELGKVYVKKYFPESSKKKVEKLVHNVTDAYKTRLETLEWMSKDTKREALKKLKNITYQIGYPNKWQSYKNLKIDQESFAQNILNGNEFHFKLEVKKLEKPTDPTEWPMPASIVNACYSPNLNQITFPAGILQSPFFNPSADDAINYGACGVIIGHELTHGFDDEGSHFDKDGNLKNWWSSKDKLRFANRTKILEKQFNAFKVVDGINVNGKLTLGENIADLGGAVIAYQAFKLATKGKRLKTINGFTPDQRFFISFSLSERTMVRDEYLKFMVLNDPHSPAEFRVNGILAHCGEFYEAFDVKKGDALYLPSEKRAHIW